MGKLEYLEFQEGGGGCLAGQEQKCYQWPLFKRGRGGRLAGQGKKCCQRPPLQNEGGGHLACQEKKLPRRRAQRGVRSFGGEYGTDIPCQLTVMSVSLLK